MLPREHKLACFYIFMLTLCRNVTTGSCRAVCKVSALLHTDAYHINQLLGDLTASKFNLEGQEARVLVALIHYIQLYTIQQEH